MIPLDFFCSRQLSMHLTTLKSVLIIFVVPVVLTFDFALVLGFLHAAFRVGRCLRPCSALSSVIFSSIESLSKVLTVVCWSS